MVVDFFKESHYTKDYIKTKNIIRENYSWIDHYMYKIYMIIYNQAHFRCTQYHIHDNRYDKDYKNPNINITFTYEKALLNIGTYLDEDDNIFREIFINYSFAFKDSKITRVYSFNKTPSMNDEMFYKYKYIRMLDTKYGSNKNIKVCHNKLYKNVKELIDFLDEKFGIINVYY